MRKNDAIDSIVEKLIKAHDTVTDLYEDIESLD